MDVSLLDAEPLTGLRLSSLANDSAVREADAFESDAVAELTVLAVPFCFCCFGMALAAGLNWF